MWLNCNISFEIGKNGISQTPQVFIDCQVISDKEGLHINWDYRKDVFEVRLSRICLIRFVIVY